MDNMQRSCLTLHNLPLQDCFLKCLCVRSLLSFITFWSLNKSFFHCWFPAVLALTTIVRL